MSEEIPELIALGPDTLLLDDAQVQIAAGGKLGEVAQPIVLLNLTGRINHSTERKTFKVAMDPRSAFGVSGLILDVLEAAANAAQAAREAREQ